MKIGIGVQGRFHAFHLAQALVSRGHDVTVFTNYPRWATRKFGLRDSNVRSFWGHGVVSRGMDRLASFGLIEYPTPQLLTAFGRRVAAAVRGETWDVLHLWSGAAEETLLQPRVSRLLLIMRGSAHIREQRRLLEDEESRIGCPIDKPGEWIVQREEREYQLTDRIVTLSSFARDSFLAQGVPHEKLLMVPLGANVSAFMAPHEVVRARINRVIAGEPLRVLFVGTLSARKGIVDIVRVVKAVSRDRFRFRFVGPVMPEAQSAVRELSGLVEVVGKQPESTLPDCYKWGDIFFFPTIEDGFAAVLAQAQASGLPILTTTNCSGPDIVRSGVNGWVVPIRDARAFIERLEWFDAHRTELSELIARAAADITRRDWADVAADFESLCEKELSREPFVSISKGRD